MEKKKEMLVDKIVARLLLTMAMFSGSFAIVLTLILSITPEISNKEISFFPVWVIVILLPLLGLFLFWFRSRFRVYYGTIEFIVGYITALIVFLPTKFDYTQLQPLTYLQILGGLYTMVRGLDNMTQGLRGIPVEPTLSLWKEIVRGDFFIPPPIVKLLTKIDKKP